MSRRLPTLLLTVLLCTTSCARSHVVRVRPPACLTTPPPVPGPEIQPGTAAETRYLVELHAWAWGAWRACRAAP